MEINYFPPDFFNNNEGQEPENSGERSRAQQRANSIRRQLIGIVGENTLDALISHVNGPGDGSDTTLAMNLKKDRSTAFRRRKAAYANIRRQFRF